jgi:hypothetical protein
MFDANAHCEVSPQPTLMLLYVIFTRRVESALEQLTISNQNVVILYLKFAELRGCLVWKGSL